MFLVYTLVVKLAIRYILWVQMLVDYAFFCTFGRLAFVLGTFSTNFCTFFIFKLLLMRSIAIYILLFGILCGCVSTKKYNAQLAEKKSIEQLRGDVDYLYSKLLGNHPQLYWYIGENQLKAKFDSLKRSISEPMVAHDFYFKLAPLVASIRQGHTRLIPLNKRFTAKERDSLKVKKYGATPFSKLGFAIFNGKLYVVKSDSWDKSVPVGAEIVEVNGIGSDVLLSKYRSTLTADGYITTFVDRMLANRFPSFFMPILTLPIRFCVESSLMIQPSFTLLEEHLLILLKLRVSIRMW